MNSVSLHNWEERNLGICRKISCVNGFVESQICDIMVRVPCHVRDVWACFEPTLEPKGSRGLTIFRPPTGGR